MNFNQNIVPEHEPFKLMLLAPVATRKFFLREIGLAYLLNGTAIASFFYLLACYGVGVFAQTLGIWFMVFLYQNIRGFYFKTFLLYQMLLMNPQVSLFVAPFNIIQINSRSNKIVLMRQMRKTLNSKHFKSNTTVSKYIIGLYGIAGIMTFLGFLADIFTQTSPFMNPVSNTIILLTTVFMVKFTFTIKHQGRVQEISAEESINQFLVDLPFNDMLKENMSECPICFMAFEDNQIVSEFQCPKLHIYHKDCIVQWLNQSASEKSCPYCRQTPDLFMD